MKWRKERKTATTSIADFLRSTSSNSTTSEEVVMCRSSSGSKLFMVPNDTIQRKEPDQMQPVYRVQSGSTTYAVPVATQDQIPEEKVKDNEIEDISLENNQDYRSAMDTDEPQYVELDNEEAQYAEIDEDYAEKKYQEMCVVPNPSYKAESDDIDSPIYSQPNNRKGDVETSSELDNGYSRFNDID